MIHAKLRILVGARMLDSSSTSQIRVGIVPSPALIHARGNGTHPEGSTLPSLEALRVDNDHVIVVEAKSNAGVQVALKATFNMLGFCHRKDLTADKAAELVVPEAVIEDAENMTRAE